jgi:hypothetical protein
MDDITGVGTHRVAAPEARAREGPARPFPSSIFLDKNRRDIGKSQVNGPIPRWKRPAHTRGAAAAAAAADADVTSLPHARVRVKIIIMGLIIIRAD